MSSNNNSFSIFLNIILGLLFAGSVVFAYFFGNFGGISIKELNDNYLPKEELTFQKLPKNVQKKYIQRDTLTQKNNPNDYIKKAFDDEGNPLSIEAESADDYNKIVDSLQKRIIFLEKENIFLSNDKEELLKIVEHEKSKNNTVEKSLLSSNLEKINEAEQQHYKNISQLTIKINDLQRENIRLSQQINGKNDIAKIKIEKLEKLLEDQKNESLVNQKNALKSVELKYANLENEKKSLQAQLNILREDIETQKTSSVMSIGKKDQKIESLQNKINQLMMEKYDILTKNSQSILAMEKRNSKKLQEFNDIIKNSSSEKEAIKIAYLKTIEKIENKYENKIKEQQNKIDSIALEHKREKQNSLTVLSNNEELLKKKQDENNKKLNKQIELVEDLNKKIKTIDGEKKNLLLSLDKQTKLNNLREDKILQLEDKIKNLDKNERNLDAQIDEIVKINEEKHNTNYKILNEKIAILEQNMKLKQSSSSKVLAALSNEKSDLIDKLNKIRNENKEQKQQLAEFKNKISKILEEKKILELSENEKLTNIRKSFESLQKDVLKQEKEYNVIIVNLEKQIASKNSELDERAKDKEKLGKYLKEITSLKKMLKEVNINLAKTKAISSSKKLVKIDSVECDDMNSGNFKISSTCKAKVDEFLGKYSTNDFFEIIPIVGTGGFASLNLIKRKSKLGISDEEIERLTNLSNLGLGKHRAKEAGWLIREKFGDNTKISYTVYNIEAQNKRGFVIRVYR